jgi:hypothetical protein
MVNRVRTSIAPSNNSLNFEIARPFNSGVGRFVMRFGKGRNPGGNLKLSVIIACAFLIIIMCAGSSSAQSKSKQVRKTTNAASDIRKVDFKNFNYGPLCPGEHQFFAAPGDKIVLRKGHDQFGDAMNYADLGSVKYVDFDGDGKEEAFVIINGQTSGSSNTFLAVYVFAYRNGSARQIWSKCEENSAAKLVGRSILFTYPEWVGDDAHCCPSYFTTDTYRWRGSRIARISKKRKNSS